MASHEEIIAAVVEKQIDTNGLEWARNNLDVHGLKIGDDGEVEVSGRAGHVLDDLVDRIEEATGMVGVSLAARTITRNFSGDLDIELPEKLARRL